MNEKKIILGIETSCDETAVSIIEEDKNGKIKILSNVVSSQFDIHKEFGGVVPELAARAHIEKIDLITKKALDESGINLNDVDAVATTAGPGLIVCLSVGLNFGKAIAASIKKQNDLSIGNLIGSNIFNLLVVIGITSTVLPI